VEAPFFSVWLVLLYSSTMINEKVAPSEFSSKKKDALFTHTLASYRHIILVKNWYQLSLLSYIDKNMNISTIPN
jgi:hypothetical protein